MNINHHNRDFKLNIRESTPIYKVTFYDALIFQVVFNNIQDDLRKLGNSLKNSVKIATPQNRFMLDKMVLEQIILS